MNASSDIRGYGLALLATVLWSTVFPIARILPSAISPIELAFWRWLFTFLCMLPFGIGQVKAHWAAVQKNWKWLLPAGILGFSVYSVLMFEAAHTTEATNLSLFAATAPIFMALLACFFLGERLSPFQFCGLAIAILGVAVLVCRNDFRHLSALTFAMGDIWMLLAAFLFALYSILVRKRPADLPQKAVMTAMLAGSLLSLFPFMGYEAMQKGYALPDTGTFLIILYIAVVPTLMGYLLWNRSVDDIGAARAGIIYYSIPFFSSVEAVLFLHEPVSLSQVIGGVLIISGILLSSFHTLKMLWRHKT